MTTKLLIDRELLPCPFCGDRPELPSGEGTQYEIECSGCGQAMASVQICDLMSVEERAADSFTNYRYADEFVERAKKQAIESWNTRAAPRQPGGVDERGAFEHLVVSVTDPDNRTTTEYVITESVVLSLWKRIAELEGNHDTKGSRKSLGAMNAKLRAKVGRLERELTLAQSERVPAWITVSERLPEPCTDVLAYGVNHRSHSYVVAGVFSGTWASQETEEATRFEPTHWMPLPPAPESSK